MAFEGVANSFNICGLITRLSLRQDWGKRYEQELSTQDAMSRATARDYEHFIESWSSISIMVAGIAILPLGWVSMQIMPALLVPLIIVLIFLPMAGIICSIEIRLRLGAQLISKRFKGIPPRGLTWLTDRKSLRVSSFISYICAMALYPALGSVIGV